MSLFVLRGCYLLVHDELELYKTTKRGLPGVPSNPYLPVCSSTKINCCCFHRYTCACTYTYLLNL